jgi:hypothetical protein
VENEADETKVDDDKGNDDGGGDDKGNPDNDDEADDLYDSDKELNHVSKPAEESNQQTPKTNIPKIAGSKTVSLDPMHEDVMNQVSIMVQMMSKQAEQLTAQSEQIFLQPSYIDVTQVEASGPNQMGENTSLKKNNFQNESSQVNTTKSFGGKFQGSLEGCSGVKTDSSVKV